MDENVQNLENSTPEQRAKRARRNIRLITLFCIILPIGALGFMLSRENSRWNDANIWIDSVYRSLQLFVLNFDGNALRPDANHSILLIFSRFIAPSLLIYAFIERFWNTAVVENKEKGRLEDPNHVVLVGFGPTGKAIARRLCHSRKRADNAALVILTHSASPDAVRLAEDLDAVILYGDPSSFELLERAIISDTAQVYVALDDDLATLDALEAVQGVFRHIDKEGHASNSKITRPSKITGPVVAKIRAFFSDMDFVHNLADADASGFWLQAKTRCFSIKWETAKQLIREARFDRAALARGQDRLHLAIVGAGFQAEAILVESLNSCLRIDLKPPKISVIGKGADALKERLRRRAPGFFLDPAQGGLYTEARPELAFIECDPETLNFAEQDGLRHDATAWVVCTPDENVNLRVSIALQAAMRRKNVRGGQIHMRVWGGDGGEVHEIASRSIGMIRVFGALGKLLDHGEYFDQDLDAGAIDLHRRYQAAGKILAYAKLIDGFAEPNWQDLAESFRASNRRLARHGPMKLEDLGFHWRGLTGLGQLSGPDRADYESKIPDVTKRAEELSDEISKNFLRAFIQEHDRWTIDRAIDGWLYGTTRDDARRIHDSMLPWEAVNETTRQYDSILIRALLLDQPASGQSSTRHQMSKTLLQPAFFISAKTVRVAADGKPHEGDIKALPKTVTELTLAFNEEDPKRPGKTKIAADAERSTIVDLSNIIAQRQHLCIVRLVFQEPPSTPVFDLAAKIADIALAKGLRVETDWAWEAQPFPPAIGGSSAA